jgi:hypothetical protein
VQLVANAMLWTEGFDARATSCVALVRPTRSRSLVTQMIGRGTRLSPETGKTSCLVLDFVPGRMSSIRLAAPADALAGEPLPDDIAEHVRVASADGGDLGELIENARAHAVQLELQEMERKRAEADAFRRRVQSVGVHYAAPTLDIDQLLDVVAASAPSGGSTEPASFKQQLALRNAGLDVPDTLTRAQATALFNVLERRRAAGLCTIKMARKLAGYGLPDDVSYVQAGEWLDAIARNSWRLPRDLAAEVRRD